MANNFGLFFTRNSQVIRLPVNPEKLPVARESENSEYNVLGLGPIMIPRTPKLRQVTISSFFPGKTAPYVLTPNGFREPEFYIQFFQEAMDGKTPILYTPVRYYEDGSPFMAGDTGFPVLVTSFTTEERGGETGDFYYDLTLTEYRDYSPQVIEIPPQPVGKATAEVARDIPAGQLYVGATVIANGKYWYSSYGDKPFGVSNGRRCKVSRIVSGDPIRPYPVHITTEDGGALGWLAPNQVQVVSSQ